MPATKKSPTKRGSDANPKRTPQTGLMERRENHRVRSDLFAVALCAFVIFLACAVISYDPADPASIPGVYQADSLVWPVNSAAHNVAGRWGAVAADILFNSFGAAAFFVVGSLAVVDVRLLRRHSTSTPMIRIYGWLAALAGITTCLDVLVPTWSPGPVIGAGGHLGVIGRMALETQFTTNGALIIAASLVAGGLLVCADTVVLKSLRVSLGVALLTAVGLWKVTTGLRRKRESRPVDDLPSSADAETSPSASAQPAAAEGAADAASQAAPKEPPQAEPELKVRRKKPAPADAKDGRRVDATHVPLIRRRAKERMDMIESLDEASQRVPTQEFQLPDIDLLIEGDDFNFDEQEKEVRRKARILEETFASFGFQVKVVEVETGPVIAQYEVELESGLRLSRITGLADDLAIALRVPSVRIVAPIPGKNTVGIEVPNDTRQLVRLREVIEESGSLMQKMRIPLFLGKDVSGNPLLADLATLPHLLIAGRTGTGKSVCLNAIISSILMTRRPDEVRMLMIDPKMVELCGYGRLPHLMHPVVTDMRKAEAILAWAVDKMEERYTLLAKAGVRHISSYNQLSEEELLRRLEPETDEEREAMPLHLPFIVIVADEMADLMMTAGKEVEQHIIRLAQKSRAVGIHLILATQKPTVDVITGLIKSNLPARIAFQVASRTDSRVVLDEMGADRLLGNGDMLFLWPGTSTLLRGQGTYLSDDEINHVVDAVSTGEQNFVNELVNLEVTEETEKASVDKLKKRDDLYERAVDVVVQEGRGSVSLLQRSLGIGYGRAARLIDFMAEDGIVGDYNGSQARDVLLTAVEWRRMQGDEPQDELSDDEDAATPRRRSNRITRPDDDWDENDLFDDEEDFEEEYAETA